MNQCKRCGAITVCVDCYPDSDAAKAMAGLPWTDAKPTVPGAYWVKDGGEEVVTIFEIEGELRVYVPGVRHSINLDEFCRRVGNRTLQFAGPIPTPKEETPAK